MKNVLLRMIDFMSDVKLNRMVAGQVIVIAHDWKVHMLSAIDNNDLTMGRVKGEGDDSKWQPHAPDYHRKQQVRVGDP
jgi:hypothetical protein